MCRREAAQIHPASLQRRLCALTHGSCRPQEIGELLGSRIGQSVHRPQRRRWASQPRDHRRLLAPALAAVTALRARDESGPEIALQVLVYPVTDCDLDTASYRRCATGCGMSARDMEWYWHHYMGHRDRSDPDASPLRAASLAGVAPAHVVVCENDVLHDEGVAYAERLKADGVPVTLRDVEGMIHGYIRMAAHFDRSRELWDDCAAALREAFGAD